MERLAPDAVVHVRLLAAAEQAFQWMGHDVAKKNALRGSGRCYPLSIWGILRRSLHGHAWCLRQQLDASGTNINIRKAAMDLFRRKLRLLQTAFSTARVM
jgi:hypothetical protein